MIISPGRNWTPGLTNQAELAPGRNRNHAAEIGVVPDLQCVGGNP